MRIKTLLLAVAFWPSFLFAQTTVTPNLGLQIPSYHQQNWQVPINYDMSLLDAVIAGAANLPAGTPTPVISKSANWITANTSVVTLTNLLGGAPGQPLRLICGPGDTFTEISGSANIVVSVSWSCSSSNSISLILLGSVWQETARAGGVAGSFTMDSITQGFNYIKTPGLFGPIPIVWNGNFEWANIEGNPLPPLGWISDPPITLSYETSAPCEGLSSLKAVFPGNPSGNELMQNASYIAQPGDTFYLSAIAKSDGTVAATVRMLFIDGTDTQIGDATATTNSTSCTPISVVGVAPAGTVAVDLSLTITPLLGVPGTAWYDAINVYRVNHPEPEIHTGTDTLKSINGVAAISPSNPQGWTGATMDAWANSAIATFGPSGAELYIAAGQYAPAGPITLSAHPAWIHGAGMNETYLQPTSALVSALFTISTATEGMKISDLTIDMVHAQTQGVFNFTTGLRPVLENVRILYPASTGTGTALFKQATGEVHVRNLIILGAGICVDINGDSGQEDFWDNVVCESPGSFGYRLLRTTTTDIGGQYLTHFKVTNPANRTGAQAFLVSSTVNNTSQPWFCVQCVGDNIQGGHTFQFNNVVDAFLDTPWAVNTASGGSNFSGINVTNSNNIFVRGGYLFSNSRDFSFSGTDASITLDHNFFAGTATNIYATGATLSTISLTFPNFTAATPISAADLTAIMNATNPTQIVIAGSLSLGVGIAVASLPAASANPGRMFYVADSTAVAAEGQTCVGSNTNKALAFSNGSVWKCF